MSEPTSASLQPAERPDPSPNGAPCCRVGGVPEPDPGAVSRRKLMLAGVNAVTAALLGVPVLGYLLAPIFRRAQTQKVQVGPLASYAEAEPKRVRITYETAGVTPTRVTQNVWVTVEKGAPVVFSSECTHLGCNVSWKPAESIYFCPCHGGKFSPAGAVLGGPPPAPLRRLPAFVENGVVYVGV